MLNCKDESSQESDEEIDEDEVRITARQVSDAVVYATDWTTETIQSQINRGNINISPGFQRRDAWTIIKKSRFIESIILGLPIPQIVLAENKNERGKYIVIDGKQRLLTILQFTSKEGKNGNFELKGLEVRTDLIGKSFSDLENDIELEGDLNQFNNQTIRSVVIRNWPNNDFLHLIFVRLNTNSVQLSPQELRQALFPGEFTNRLDEAACNSKSLQILLRIKEPDFRMRDVEILLRYLAFSFFISDYSGNLKQFLDETCSKLNDNWAIKMDEIEEKINNFEDAIFSAIEIFGKDRVGRKWTHDGFESRLNRAVVDITHIPQVAFLL
jgi:uncharacterized protein with ParB-like and HNH nuclease domain